MGAILEAIINLCQIKIRFRWVRVSISRDYCKEGRKIIAKRRTLTEKSALCSCWSVGTKTAHLIICEPKNGNLDNKEGTQEPYPTHMGRVVLCNKPFPGTQRVRRFLKLPCFPCSGQAQYHYFPSHPSSMGVLPQGPANIGWALHPRSLLSGLPQAGWGGRRARRGKIRIESISWAVAGIRRVLNGFPTLFHKVPLPPLPVLSHSILQAPPSTRPTCQSWIQLSLSTQDAPAIHVLLCITIIYK